MRNTHKSRDSRALRNPHAVAERLAIWSEDARRAGREARADELLLAAWEAFDLPEASEPLAHMPDMSALGQDTARGDGLWLDHAA